MQCLAESMLSKRPVLRVTEALFFFLTAAIFVSYLLHFSKKYSQSEIKSSEFSLSHDEILEQSIPTPRLLTYG